MKLPSLQRLLGLGMGAVLLLSLIIWYTTREVLPGQLILATGQQGGLYYKLGKELKAELESKHPLTVTVLPTEGSVHNRQLLESGKADLAIFQNGSVSMEGMGVISPLYLEPFFLVVRKKDKATSFSDLNALKVATGTKGSGMAQSAQSFMQHYNIKANCAEVYFEKIAHHTSFDAALITTGLLNPDLHKLFADDQFNLLSIPDTQAFVIHHPSWEPYTIPRGLFGESPSRPAQDTKTLATTAVLVTRKQTSAPVIQHTLAALYEGHLQATIPTLFTRNQAASWHTLPLLPAAQEYFDPYQGIGLLTNFLESIAAFKELVFAFLAGFYLLWNYHKQQKHKERQAEVNVLKEKLDTYLEETVRIERAQMDTQDQELLKKYLDEVTNIKLEALEHLTHEDLRSDRQFSIFLMQCANLIGKIQAKIELTAIK